MPSEVWVEIIYPLTDCGLMTTYGIMDDCIKPSLEPMLSGIISGISWDLADNNFTEKCSRYQVVKWFL